jgi:hypothetical protein
VWASIFDFACAWCVGASEGGQIFGVEFLGLPSFAFIGIVKVHEIVFLFFVF